MANQPPSQMTLPIGAAPIGFATPPNVQDKVWTYTRQTLLGVNDGSLIAQAFEEHGVYCLPDLASLSLQDIESMKYRLGGPGMPPDPINRGMISKMKSVIAMYHDVSRQLGDTVDMRTLPLLFFNNCRLRYYDPNVYPKHHRRRRRKRQR
jgi:hypothetical protein